MIFTSLALLVILILIVIIFIVTFSFYNRMENFENVMSKPRTTPKDFFMNLGWVVTLYGSVISLLSLLFATINKVFPDALGSYYYYGSSGYSSGIRWAIAWLIVVFPIYIIITRYLRKSYVLDVTKSEIWVRKWLVYLTLFLSSATVIVDLIVVINSFLGGELTMRFFMKVLATLIVAGMVFGYYFYDLRTEGKSGMAGKIFAIGSIVLVLGSLVWAFVVIGSPMNERLRRFDQQKVQNLQDIQWRITTYWQNNGKLPVDLKTIEDSIGGYKVAVDPETQKAYEYKVTGTTDFELCAEFNLDNNDEMLGYQKVSENDFWNHGKGNVCFKRTIDKSLYPIRALTPVPVKY